MSKDFPVHKSYSRRRFLQVSGAMGFTVAATAGGGYAVAQTPAVPAELSQSPLFDSMDLPPLAERIGSEPHVLNPLESVGTYGGQWRTALIGGQDTAWLERTVNYDNLVTWSVDWSEVLPNVAQSFEVSEDGRSYTFKLRAGHKWSDGEPFTSADVEFYVNNVRNNAELNPAAPDNPFTIEVADEQTFTIIYERPNGFALQRMCEAAGVDWTRYPRHYLEQFHIDFNPDGIDALIAEEGAADWIELFRTKGAGIPGTPYDARWSNPELPRLHAYTLVEPYGEGTRVSFERNPYYFKVDPSGQQLPYIDEVVFDVLEDPEVLLLRASNGEIDMHARHITTNTNKPVLAENRESGGYEFFDIVPSSMNEIAIAVNQTHKVPEMREIFGNKDFRAGLSHAINRQEIIDVVYVSQGEPWQLAPRTETDYYNETLAKQFTEFDVDLANEHLDRVLPDKDGDGMRLMPSGEPFSFVVEVTADQLERVDACNLVIQYWNAVGINASLNPEDRSLMYTRKDANEHDCAVWGGDGGLNDAMLEARWYFPHSTESLYGVGWVIWDDRAGGTPQAEPVEPPESIQRQMDLYQQIEETPDPAVQTELFNELLAIAQEEYHAIGVSLPALGYGLKKVNLK
ncbi:MAG: ABC transporter substrate-binding protein, partial [Chloroflexota bacterium]|nr:ABC transporter substrate-binding protein [Chloroflexota bacterium]